VRQGSVVSPTALNGVPAAPLFLVADVGRGLARWPLTAAGQVADAVKGIARPDVARSSRIEYEALRKGFGDPQQIQVSLGDFCVTSSDRALAVWRLPFFPLRMVAAPLSDAFGTPGWDNFSRRTRNLFRQPYESASTDSAYGYKYQPGQGGASILMDSIASLVKADAAAGVSRPITLVGHSMGTIILDEAIRLYPDLEFTSIVYMASASSIRDFMAKVVPYLERHHATKFYNLTLHPAADAREQLLPILPVMPGGSLLEYIDDYYAKPLTFVDRMLGKWNNIMEATHLVPDSIRGQITIKGFGVHDPNQPVYGNEARTPRIHADFNDPGIGFWREDFWQAVAPGDTADSVRCRQ
jgi:pimeloyl-ACP methyl ester carboxylesterase